MNEPNELTDRIIMAIGSEAFPMIDRDFCKKYSFDLNAFWKEQMPLLESHNIAKIVVDIMTGSKVMKPDNFTSVYKAKGLTSYLKQEEEEKQKKLQSFDNSLALKTAQLEALEYQKSIREQKQTILNLEEINLNLSNEKLVYERKISDLTERLTRANLTNAKITRYYTIGTIILFVIGIIIGKKLL